MPNMNLNPGSQTPFSGGMFGMPGSNGMDFGMAPMQQMFTQAMNTMSMTMMTLMTQMMTQQVAMLGSSLFGGEAGKSQGSPLGGFLGGANGGAMGLKPTAKDAKPNGKRIPGGKSLYGGKGMFHKGAPGAPNTYAFENSPAGIKFAAKHGYKSIDLDMQITKDGVPVVTHWSKPLEKDGFYDPKGKIGKGKKVSDMTLAEVMRLRNKDGKSQIYPLATMVQHLKKNGIAGDLEAKNDKRFASDKMMGYIANLVRDAGIKANLKSIHRGALTDKILETAQDHGFFVKIALAKNGQQRYPGYA
jgi:hypothetical protein